jgi:hypothetical protein
MSSNLWQLIKTNLALAWSWLKRKCGGGTDDDDA